MMTIKCREFVSWRDVLRLNFAFLKELEQFRVRKFQLDIYHKKDPNRILYALSYIVMILPMLLIIIWIILDSIGFMKRG